MLGAFKTAIDLALQGRGTRLVGLAESYKRRTLNEVKVQTVSAGITVALVGTALAFLLIAVTIGLASLFYWVALRHGTLAGLGAAGAASMLLSLVLMTVVALRSKSPARTPPARSSAATGASDMQRYPVTTSSHFDASGTAALGKKSVDAATGIMREGSREAVLATLAATVVIGMLLGRRR